MDFGQQRARKRDPEVFANEVVQRADVEGTDLDGDESVASKRKLRGQHAHVRTAGREENGHALFPQASRRIAECSRRGGVKPLNVVDRDEDGTLDGEAAERVEHCDADRVPIRIRALAVLLENEARARARRCGAGAASAPRPPQRRASHQSPKSRARFRSPPDAPGARGGRAPRPLRCTPSRGSSCRCRPRPLARARLPAEQPLEELHENRKLGVSADDRRRHAAAPDPTTRKRNRRDPRAVSQQKSHIENPALRLSHKPRYVRGLSSGEARTIR